MNPFPSQNKTRRSAVVQRSYVRRALVTFTCTLLAACADYSHAAVVLSQWNFNDVGNPNSSVSNVGGFTGTFIGSTVTRSADTFGVSGTAGDYSLSLGGSGVAGAMMDATTPNFITALNAIAGTQSLSISFWQNLNAITQSTALWAESPSVTRGLNAHSPWSDGNIYWDTAGCCTNGVHRLSTGLAPTLGEWQLITLIYDNGNKSIYRGATQIASGSGFNLLTTDLSTFYVGNQGPTFDLLPNARYDNFTLWSGALTPTEVAALAVRPVPEPSTVLLLGAGSLLAMCRRRHS